MIKETDLTEEEKEKIVTYFGYLPEFHFYALSNIEETNNIDAPKFAEKILEASKVDDGKLGGKFSFIDDENYVATVGNRKNLYHEVTHLIFYKQIEDFFEDKKIDNRRNLIDEIIAEYHSTKINGESNIFIAKFKMHQKIYKEDIPYLIGAYLAYKDIGSSIINNAPDWLVEKAEIVKDVLKIGKTSFEINNYDLLKQLYKQ